MFTKEMHESALKHEVIIIRIIGKHSVFASVCSDNSEKIYFPFISGSDFSCGCEHVLYKNTPCSHILAILKNYPQFMSNIIGVPQMVKSIYAKTDLENFNMLVGGVPKGTPLALYGSPEAGKTIALNQLMHQLLSVKNSGNGLIIDTEGSMFSITEWHQVFRKRYKLKNSLSLVKVRIKEKNVGRGTKTVLEYEPAKWTGKVLFVLDIRSIERLLSFFGKSATIDISEKGKISLKTGRTFATNVEDSMFSEMIEKHNLSCVGLDSLTQPFSAFGIERVNFPARAQAINWVLSALHDLSETHDLFSIVTVHASADPTTNYGRPIVTGGKAVGHSFKFVVFLADKPTSKTPKIDPIHANKRTATTRELWNKRHPSKVPFGNYVMLELTRNGYIDVKM